MNETITITRKQLEKIHSIWCHEFKENPDTFESINVDEMNDEEIDEYAKNCADYVIRKFQEL